MSKPDLMIERRERDCIEVVALHGAESAVAAQLDGPLPLGPSRWLMMAGYGEADSLSGRLSQELAGTAAVIDQSSAYVTFRVSGVSAREALARLCRLDLHPKVFAPGHAARTLMAQMPVIIHLIDAQACFELHVPMTLARSFSEHLLIAARSFGVTAISDERQHP